MTTEAISTPESIGGLEKLLNSSLFSVILTGVLVYIAVLWIAIILWVTKDITNRTNNVFFQICCISLVIFLTPIFGLVIYLILRPTKTIVEQYYEEFELDLMQTEEQSKEVEHCPYCSAKTDPSFHFCSMCGKEISKHCGGCEKMIRLNWSSCPYCGKTQEKLEKEVKTEKKKTTRKKKEESSSEAIIPEEKEKEENIPS